MGEATRGRRLVGILLAVLLIGACSRGAIAPSARDAHGGPRTAVEAASPTAAAPTESATATPAIPVDAWQPVPDQDSLAGLQLYDVAWNGTRFVAVADAVDSDGGFLDSTDGLTWHRGQPGGGSLASGPAGVVAVGGVGDPLASWWSADGLAWTPSSGGLAAPSGGKGAGGASDAVATDAGWLAVGRLDVASGPTCVSACPIVTLRALVWTSPDGLRWSPVAAQASLQGAGMNAVTNAGPGFVAAGNDGDHAAFWTARDGTAWSRVPDTSAFHRRHGTDSTIETTALGVASGHGVIVAVGMDSGAQDVGGGNSARAWWSTDGRTWTNATVERSQESQVFGVSATPTGFLMTGPSGGPPGCASGIWDSTDGRSWTCTALAPGVQEFSPYAAAASSSMEIVVGFALSEDEEVTSTVTPVLWRAIP